MTSPSDGSVPIPARVEHDPRLRAGVVFDVDGTLLDTVHLHVVAWMQAFAELGEHPPMATIHGLIGRSGDDLVRLALGRPEPVAERLHAERFADLRRWIVPLPGAADLVRHLRRVLDVTVVLASSASPEDHARNLEVLGLEDDVATAVAAGDVERAKPAPDIFELAVDEGRLDPTATVVIGDTRYDVEAAGRAGLPAVAVRTGGIGEAELRDAGAVEVYADLVALHRALPHSIVGRLTDGTPFDRTGSASATVQTEPVGG